MIRTQPNFVTVEKYQAPSDLDWLDSSLPAVMVLINALKDKNIRYCHWKSNSRLDMSLAGQTDLDLLVDPQDQKSFEGILSAQNIKKIVAPKDKQYPGMEHYLGFDFETGKLIHLHVHYKLVLGEQYVKNYHVPIEEKILNSTREQFGVRIPNPEVELVLLSIRALLKYRDRDVVKDIFNIRHAGIPAHISQELLWLLNQSSIVEAAKTLESFSIFEQPAWIYEFLEIIQNNQREGWRLFKLRSRLRKELRPYQRNPRIISSIKYFIYLAKNSSGVLGSKDQRLKFPGKGKLIALVGIDGSGKSTQTADLTKWLQWKISTPLFYLGSKQPSWMSELSYLVFRIFRRSHSILSNRIGGDNFLANLLVRFRSFFLASHFLFIGRDRYRRYRLAKKLSDKGSIVIFDRFPFFSPLDGPEIRTRLKNDIGFVTRKLANIEKIMYRKFDYLDLLIILNVKPEDSVLRKPDHPLETIQAKFNAINRLKDELETNKRNFVWTTIESDQPLDKVLLDIKREVWKTL